MLKYNQFYPLLQNIQHVSSHIKLIFEPQQYYNTTILTPNVIYYSMHTPSGMHSNKRLYTLGLFET
jgi:hypothetical protein